MNQDKARDFFSAYYEGTLEGGLRQSFESSLRGDANLQADYSAFSETVRELNLLRDEEIEIPIYLSDRIATRLEQVQTKQQVGIPAWATWLRGLAFAGLAVAAVVFAMPLVSGNKTATAGFSGSNLDQVRFKYDGSKLVLMYQPSSSKTLVVSSPSNGKEVQRFHLDGQRVESPIENATPNATVFKIEAIGDKNPSLIAVPGTRINVAKTGEGSVQDLAIALSGHYRVPVSVEAADVTHHLSWNFTSSDPRTAASQAIGTDGFSVDLPQDGVLRILDR